MLDSSVKHIEDWEEWGEASNVPKHCVVFELLLDCLNTLLGTLGYSKMLEVTQFFKVYHGINGRKWKLAHMVK
jgi:hypothetical protein